MRRPFPNHPSSMGTTMGGNTVDGICVDGRSANDEKSDEAKERDKEWSGCEHEDMRQARWPGCTGEGGGVLWREEGRSEGEGGGSRREPRNEYE